MTSKIETSLDQRYLRPPAAAKYMGLSIGTLARWRVEGRGPRFSRVGPEGSSILYDRRAIDEFVEAGQMTSTQTPADAAA